jgi:hypothetical protein
MLNDGCLFAMFQSATRGHAEEGWIVIDAVRGSGSQVHLGATEPGLEAVVTVSVQFEDFTASPCVLSTRSVRRSAVPSPSRTRCEKRQAETYHRPQPRFVRPHHHDPVRPNGMFLNRIAFISFP